MPPAEVVETSGSGGLVLLFVAIVFFVLVTLFWLLFQYFQPKRSAADRLEGLAQGRTGDALSEENTRDSTLDLWQNIATQVGERIAGGSEAEIEAVRATLRHGGFRHRRALEIYRGTQLLVLFGAPALTLPLAAVFSLTGTLFAAVVAMVVGYLAPSVYISNLASTRRTEMLLGFPDALDLLVSSVEAGLGVDQAFRRVSDEMGNIAPQLAREFNLVNNEVTAGIDRLTALKHLEDRTGLDEVGSLVNMLAQAERYGTSIAEALRIFSQVTREKRMAGAEEQAGKVGSKITIIMIFCFLPPLFIVLMVPTILTVVFGDM